MDATRHATAAGRSAQRCRIASGSVTTGRTTASAPRANQANERALGILASAERHAERSTTRPAHQQHRRRSRLQISYNGEQWRSGRTPRTRYASSHRSSSATRRRRTPASGWRPRHARFTSRHAGGNARRQRAAEPRRDVGDADGHVTAGQESDCAGSDPRRRRERARPRDRRHHHHGVRHTRATPRRRSPARRRRTAPTNVRSIDHRRSASPRASPPTAARSRSQCRRRAAGVHPERLAEPAPSR